MNRTTQSGDERVTQGGDQRVISLSQATQVRDAVAKANTQLIAAGQAVELAREQLVVILQALGMSQ